jgi:hypothetical protein
VLILNLYLWFIDNNDYMTKAGTIFLNNNIVNGILDHDLKLNDDTDSIEAAKNGIDTNNPSETKTLESLAKKSQNKLLTVSGVFPFDWVPDLFVIDENKITVINRSLFKAEYVHSFNFEDIKDVWLESAGPLATLKIAMEGYDKNPLTIRHITRKNAIRARRILQGVQHAVKAGIVIENRNHPEKIAEDLEIIGTALPINI